MVLGLTPTDPIPAPDEAPSTTNTNAPTLPFISGLADDDSLTLEGFTITRGASTLGDAASTNRVANEALTQEVLPCLAPVEGGDGLQFEEIEGPCPTQSTGPTPEQLMEAAVTEFQTLELAATAINYQPNGDWALVNMEFIVYVEPEVQSLSADLLGIPITIRATPVHYSWDFGDGSEALVTSSVGAPYPNQTVSHVYTEASDGVSVTLTTSWQGEFMIGDSGTWLPIAGFARTTSSAGPVEIVAMDVVLVPNDS